MIPYEKRKELSAVLEGEGYGVIPNDQYRIDMEDQFRTIWEEVSSFTMTSMERGYGLYTAVNYLQDRGIKGDFVECGVWKGGSCMLMIRTLQQLNVDSRSIWLYDTFAGMPEPGVEDIIAWNGSSVKDKWENNSFDHWAVSRETVLDNLKPLDYPQNRIRAVEGDVAVTLQQELPESISLLRLDTDWYASTCVELELLYPRLVPGGVLIIDDYGHFEGARRAVDEYFARPDVETPLFSRLDYTGRMAVKV